MHQTSGAAASSSPPLRQRWLTWILPAAICIGVFWPGLWAWFQRDDFAWLGLPLEIYDSETFWRAMFEPKAQGTIRPWSERGFFLLYSWLFGLEALPFRLTVFATQVLALYLLSRVAWRLSGSALAAFLAPSLWGVNASLGTPLAWTSAYNQVMCAAFLLGAFLLWLKFSETGDRRYYFAQFAVFLLGFGALEINIVYPGIVLAWALLAAPRLVGYAAAMMPVSVIYFFVHNRFAPKPASGLYALHVDTAMWSTFWRYWQTGFSGLGAENLELPHWLVTLNGYSPWFCSAGLALGVAAAIAGRRWVSLFGLAWFAGTIAPVLPLRDHFTVYYLTIPSIGLALAGADTISRAWQWRRPVGIAALILAGLYAAGSIPVARGEAHFFRTRSKETERFVFGVERAREIHPKKVILLTDVSADLFWSGMNDRPFRVLGIDNVFLAPGADEAIPRNRELGDVDSFVFPAGQAIRLLDHDNAVVYSVSDGRLRNITRPYLSIARTRWKASLARRVDVGNLLFAEQLLEGWHKVEGSGFRWMARRARLRLGGPGKAITVAGYAAKEVVEAGPVQLTVLVDGYALSPVCPVTEPDRDFTCRLNLPETVGAKDALVVELSLNKALLPNPSEDREMGLILGTVTIE